MKSKSKSWDKTRRAIDYRTFLEAYLDESAASRSDLARAAGFGRGFPGDVISGRRRLTSKSYLAFERALKLPADGRKLFRYLVAREEPAVVPGKQLTNLDGRIEELRMRPWTQVRRPNPTTSDQDLGLLLSNPNVFSVYAAADATEGTDFKTIVGRTRLSEAEVTRALALLEKAGMISNHDDAYRLSESHLFVSSKGKDQAFVELFRSVAKRASERVPKAITSDSEFFFTSAFCVDEKRLPELKAALRRTILEFVDESIAPKGNRIAHLVTAMFL